MVTYASSRNCWSWKGWSEGERDPAALRSLQAIAVAILYDDDSSLACLSHHGWAATPNLPASAALRSVGHPHRSYGYGSGALGRDALQPQTASTFRSNRGEKCRLAHQNSMGGVAVVVTI